MSINSRGSLIDSVAKPDFEQSPKIQKIIYLENILWQEVDEIELEDLKEVVQNKTNIIIKQRPPYVMDFPSPYSQNFEDLIVSIEVQNMKLLNPLVNKNNWAPWARPSWLLMGPMAHGAPWAR